MNMNIWDFNGLGIIGSRVSWFWKAHSFLSTSYFNNYKLMLFILGCKFDNCYYTNDTNYFGMNQIEKFDALVFLLPFVGQKRGEQKYKVSTQIFAKWSMFWWKFSIFLHIRNWKSIINWREIPTKYLYSGKRRPHGKIIDILTSISPCKIKLIVINCIFFIFQPLTWCPY